MTARNRVQAIRGNLGARSSDAPETCFVHHPTEGAFADSDTPTESKGRGARMGHWNRWRMCSLKNSVKVERDYGRVLCDCRVYSEHSLRVQS